MINPDTMTGGERVFNRARTTPRERIVICTQVVDEHQNCIDVQDNTRIFTTSGFEPEEAKRIFEHLTQTMELIACAMCWGRKI